MEHNEDYEIDPFTWARSSFGNAYLSGVTYEQVWIAILLATTPEQFDAAIDAIDKLNIIVQNERRGRRK